MQKRGNVSLRASARMASDQAYLSVASEARFVLPRPVCRSAHSAGGVRTRALVPSP
jgi:hypothetical protein